MRTNKILREVAEDLATGLAYPVDCLEDLTESIAHAPRLDAMEFNEPEFKIIWEYFRKFTGNGKNIKHYAN